MIISEHLTHRVTLSATISNKPHS